MTSHGCSVFRYHNQITEESRRATTAWKKADIQNWLTNHSIEFEQSEIKAELLKKVASIETPKEYVTDKMAREIGRDIHVLRLPVGHCELNPIELIWAWVKKQISDRNTDFKIKSVETLTKQVLDEVTPELWQKCIQHVKDKPEKEWWAKDGLLDEFDIVDITDDDDEEIYGTETDEEITEDEETGDDLLQQDENTEATANYILEDVFNDV